MDASDRAAWTAMRFRELERLNFEIEGRRDAALDGQGSWSQLPALEARRTELRRQLGVS